MLAEGVDPAVIEQAALQAGYPVGPLQVADELNFATIRRIMDETVRAAEREGTPVPETTRATAKVIGVMMDEHDRAGRQAGAGFYDYEDGRRGLLWSQLREVFRSRPDGWSMTDLQERFLFVQAIESQHAFDEGVIASDADANLGSIFGIGFPPRSGGVRQFVKGYPGGPDAFRARADELATAYGPRFQVPASESALAWGTVVWCPTPAAGATAVSTPAWTGVLTDPGALTSGQGCG